MKDELKRLLKQRIPPPYPPEDLELLTYEIMQLVAAECALARNQAIDECVNVVKQKQIEDAERIAIRMKALTHESS